ncbi:MAG TPA: hypothetical protein VFE70_07140 [Candidatus Elarobacter sp.]|nr:hypothetical protein [Candidatus Elarobacter sp.]
MTSPRVEHWLRCAAKRCCYDATVFVTGADLARIARTVSVPPWVFTIGIPCAPDADDGFALEPAGKRQRLALGRARFPGEDAHCAFLVSLPDGAARCGLGDARPAGCRAFPFGSGHHCCSCDWSSVDLITEADDLGAMLTAERDRYAAVVARWNAYVDTGGAEHGLELRDFCRFLLDAYPEDGR